jgi:hypothetical protein
MGRWATSNNQPTKEREKRMREGRVHQQGERLGGESLAVRGVGLLVLGLTHFATFIAPTSNSRQALACLLPHSLPCCCCAVATQSLSFLPSPILCIPPPSNLVDCQVHSPIILVVVAAATLTVLLHPVSH